MIIVRRNDEKARYEGRIDGDIVTVIDYTRRGDVLDVTYTGTRIRFRGRGHASEVTRQALEDVRAQGWKVHPICPFTVDYMDDHPEFADVRA